MRNLLDASDCQPGSFGPLPLRVHPVSSSAWGTRVTQSGYLRDTHLPHRRKRFFALMPIRRGGRPGKSPAAYGAAALAWRSANGGFPSDDDRTLRNRVLAEKQLALNSGAWDCWLTTSRKWGFPFYRVLTAQPLSPKACSNFSGRGRGFAYSHLNSSPPKKSPQNRGGVVKITSQLAVIHSALGSACGGDSCNKNHKPNRAQQLSTSC